MGNILILRVVLVTDSSSGIETLIESFSILEHLPWYKERSHSLLEAPVGVRARLTVTWTSSLLRAPGPREKVFAQHDPSESVSPRNAKPTRGRQLTPQTRGFFLPSYLPADTDEKELEEGESHRDQSFWPQSWEYGGGVEFTAICTLRPNICHTSELFAGLPDNLGSALNLHCKS